MTYGKDFLLTQQRYNRQQQKSQNAGLSLPLRTVLLFLMLLAIACGSLLGYLFIS